MGQISSGFQLESERSQLPPNLSPARADWITAHAVVTKLAIVEIERSWKRFQQLGANSKGELPEAAFKKHSLIHNDIFGKNVMTVLKSPNGSISFLTFLNCLKWAETSTYDDKIIAVFNLLNNGDDVNRDIFMRIIKRLYPNDKSRHEQLTDVLMEQLCGNKSGTITSDIFMQRVSRLPRSTLDQLFSYLIVPEKIADEARETFTVLSKYGNYPAPQIWYTHLDDGVKSSAFLEGATPELSAQIPTDNVLARVADKIHTRDWHMLGNKLGFTQSQINEFGSQTSESAEQQVTNMLKVWRSQQGSAATCGALEEKLQQSDMADAAILLYP